jgi:hypothetical protein
VIGGAELSAQAHSALPMPNSAIRPEVTKRPNFPHKRTKAEHQAAWGLLKIRVKIGHKAAG